MSTTRSKTTSKTTSVEAFEATAAASRLAHEAAFALRQQRADDLRNAQQALAAVHAAWDSGDATLSADAEVQALAGISRATRLLAAATAAERKTQAALVSTDVSLAAALAPLVAEVLGLAPSVQPFRPTSEPTELPSLALVQTAPTTADHRSGALSGTVEVVFTRSALHKEASAEAFEAAAEDHDVRLNADAHTLQEGDVFTDFVRLRVTSLYPEVPAIVAAADPLTAATSLGNAVANAAMIGCKYKLSGSLQGLDSGTRYALTVDVAQPRVVTDRVHRGGKAGEPDRRHLTVEVEVTGVPKTVEMRANGLEPWSIGRATELLTRCIAEQQGQVVEGLGRVVSAAAVDTTGVVSRETGLPLGVAVRGRFEVVSQASPSAASEPVPAQRSTGRVDPLEDLDGSSSHPGNRR